jgi:hypothetical protein
VRLYDRLERALIALEYALADARSCEKSAASDLDDVVRSHKALQGAGEELHDIMLALKSAGLQRAAERARHWALEGVVTPAPAGSPLRLRRAPPPG